MSLPRPDDWYRHDARAFLEGVQGMGPELIGAYIVILDIFYARNGRMVRDDRHLSGVMGCSVRKARALTDQLIEVGKIAVEDGFVTNPRAETEMNLRRSEREVGAKGGRTAAENRSANSKNKDLGTTKRREEKRREEDGSNEPSARTLAARHFQDFWDAYPHRHGKKTKRDEAAKAFLKALTNGATVQEISDGVEALKRDPDTERGYQRGPIPWLNQRGWTDEIPEKPELRLEQPRGKPNGPSPAQRAAARFRETRMDSGPGGDPSVALFPARAIGSGGRGGDD